MFHISEEISHLYVQSCLNHITVHSSLLINVIMLILYSIYFTI